MGIKVTTESFLEKAKQIHENKYDYSKVDYKSAKEKICIICKKHGEFYQTPNSHLNGNGCPKCSNESTGDRCRLTTEDFIRKSREVHGDLYDYSKVDYKGNKLSVRIICAKHGEFLQNPLNHYKLGCGCPKCKGDRISKSKTRTSEDFIALAKKIHQNYDYSKVNYINSTTKVEIICPVHGSFFQDPANHLQGKGCPACKESFLEKEVNSLLRNNNIKFIEQKSWDWLVYESYQYVDFYLPDYNIVVECQGIQHFESIEHFGGEDKFEETRLRDKNKLDLCTKNGIKILYYSNLGDNYNYPYNVITSPEILINEIKKISLTN